MVPRAATDEKVRDGAMRVIVAFIPARCPADHLQFVIVTVADPVVAVVMTLSNSALVAGLCPSQFGGLSLSGKGQHCPFDWILV